MWEREIQLKQFISTITDTHLQTMYPKQYNNKCKKLNPSNCSWEYCLSPQIYT